VLWMGPILFRANADGGKPEVGKYLALKDVYKTLGYYGIDTWQLAAESCSAAWQMKQDDMDLQNELKNIGAQHAMVKGNYTAGGSFRDSIKDMKSQQKLLRQDQDFQSIDFKIEQIQEAEAALAADPNEAGKIMKLVDALEKTEETEYENRAIELLQECYDRTKQYRFRARLGDITMRQMSRMERTKRQALLADKENAELKKDYQEFRREQLVMELEEYRQRVENYPTETKFRYDVGRREFELGKFDEAIPTLQQARNDPKYRFKAGLFLARAFLEAGFLDESDETLGSLIQEYQLAGDTDSKEMYYWRARVLEKKGNPADAIKHYSKLAQWDFGYKDVQMRIKALRAAATPK